MAPYDRRVRRLAIPLLLLIAALGAGWRAVELDEDPPAAEVTTTARVTTPLLSARRIPGYLQAPIADGALRSALERLVVGASPPDSCLVVREGGRTIIESKADAPLVPASNHKLLTGVAALELLGAETRLRTTVVAAAPPANGVVEGPLWIVGGADPLLATPEFADRYGHPVPYTNVNDLVERIAAAGITEIRGEIIGDDSRLDRERVVATWPTRFVAQGQIGSIGALTLNRGFIAFSRNPEVTTGNQPAPDPAQHVAAVVRTLLTARGVRVTGPARSGVAPAQRVEVAAVESPPMSDVVGAMLVTSDNNAAEVLTKEMGRALRNEPTTTGGVAAIRQALERRGLPLDGVSFVDGSGLDPVDKATCRIVAEILTREGRTSPIGRLLPVAGQTGTLRTRFVGTPAAGKVAAKTGRLLNVNSLSGYATTADGRTLTFAYIANTAPDREIGEAPVNAQNQLAAQLVAYPQAPSLDQLAPRPATP